MRSLPQQNYRGQDYKACTVQDATQRPGIYKYKKLFSRCNGHFQHFPIRSVQVHLLASVTS